MRLASHCLCQQSLTGSRRSHQQRSLRAHSSDLLVFLRIVEKINDLRQELFRLIFARHIVKCNACGGLHIDFCIALPELHERISAASAAHLLHELPCQELSKAPEDQKRHDPA